MGKIQVAAGLTACLMALSGCGDTARSDGDGTTAGGATAGGATAGGATAGGATAGGATAGGATAGGATAGGATAGGATAGGATAGGATAGGATAGGTTAGDTGGDDGGANDSTAGGATAGADDPSTIGNDAPGLSACGEGPACGAGEKCCAFAAGSTSCKASCGLGDTEAVCDGPEDCPTGQLCCSGIAKSYCGDSCGDDFIGCHTLDECPSGTTDCRPNTVFPIWGICD